MHDRIVSIDERLRDLVDRYGHTEEIIRSILHGRNLIFAVERKIDGLMKVDLQQTVYGLGSSSRSDEIDGGQKDWRKAGQASLTRVREKNED